MFLVAISHHHGAKPTDTDKAGYHAYHYDLNYLASPSDNELASRHLSPANRRLSVFIPAVTSNCGGYYTCRNASIGSSLAARRAGYTPLARPTRTETPKATSGTQGRMIVGSPVTPDMTNASAMPSAVPASPPQDERRRLSTRNWAAMSLCLA